MAITIPDNTNIRITTEFVTPQNGQHLPNGLLDTPMTNSGAVAIATGGADAITGQAKMTPAVGAAGRQGYVGYNAKVNCASGAPISPIRRAVVDGFAGVSPGLPVYIDDTGADVSSTTSGLTHTAPGTSNVGLMIPIGVGWSSTKIYFE